MPRSLLTTSVARASPSTSSAMISSGLLALRNGFEQRHQVLGVGDLLFVDQDVGSFRARPSCSSWFGDEVRREVAAIELHAFDDFDGRLAAAAFFDRDHAVLADLHERVGQHVADRRVVVAGDRGDLLQLFLSFASIGSAMLARSLR